jgi:asparagine synthase (glutamine-hydrolysing)
MCGIAGWFGPNTGKDAEALVQALRHRGPDGSGVWESENATMVHTRLAILDLSDAGRQPMEFQKTEDSGQESEVVGRRFDDIVNTVALLSGRPSILGFRPTSFVLVFNGEIYNHAELRTDLEEQGEVFAGHSDTEVLLRLLVRQGAACLPKLAGMFAFAFWDEGTGAALLARDPLGIKPLYYREEGGTLCFASETRVLRMDGDMNDASAVRDFFLWGSVPEPATWNVAIRQLPAGHLLRWQNGECSIQQWHVGDNWTRRGGHALPDSIALTRSALLESMRRHLVSDVPVGIFLSGGIDSTALLALTREVLGPEANIRTFSIGFEDPEFDESGMAQRTAEHFGASHTEWRITSEEGAAEIPAYLAAVDQPTIDGFNTWCVSKLAQREGIKVVLSGLGGDEIFAGYGSFDRVPKFHAWHRRLGPLRLLVARILVTRAPGTPWRRLAAFFRGGGTWMEAYHAQRGIFTSQEAQVLAQALCGGAPAAPVWELSGLPTGGRDVVSQLELTRYMRNQLLRDSDVFSMAHGLELRVPFVDARFFSAVQQIPASIRLRQGKLLLLEAVPEVPEWIRNQPKRGFRFPFQAWMEGQFGELLAEAQQVSPVPLNAWYRTWAVSAALQGIRK